jgi:alkanesulfonate monooxygenase SsuD/methylene tetrahydromethanopterin reductase-like flavin-dependent oxidoreductase (luciferase family)
VTLFGYTMMGEQAGPKQLVRDVALAEEAGSDFAVISDHYFPWLEVQGHSPTSSRPGVWDLPEVPPPIGIAVWGPEGCRLAGRHADAMIATEPHAELGQMFDDAGGSGKPRIGQITLSYDPDEPTAVRRAMEQFRWVHRWLEGQRRAPGAGVVRDGVQEGARGGRGHPDAVRSRPRAAPRRDPPVRGGRVHPPRVGAGRRRHPRAIHQLGGNRTAAGPASVLTGLTNPSCSVAVGAPPPSVASTSGIAATGAWWPGHEGGEQ